MKQFDPTEIELKIGLEIHQQLATKHKLFCHCREIAESKLPFQFFRRLRPTQSELGQTDPAALFEFRRRRGILYHSGNESTCLVETDEEPPHELNLEAVETTVIIALALKSRVVDELHTMRKIVIDGSNTAGFQRTLVVALGGELDVNGEKIGVQTVSLEEDAARIIGEADDIKEYGLDRLGVPLIEVALAPIVASPQRAQEVALTLGRLMRSTKRVARGLGTIRQDVNISIKGGGVVEVKGVQKLDLLENVVEYEALRQLGLLKIRDELVKRGLSDEALEYNSKDITFIFHHSESKSLRKVIDEGGRIVAIGLKGFSGLFKFEPYQGIRLGKELAELVRFYGIGGLMHSDELPAYGVSEKEVEEVRKSLRIEDQDGFVVLAGDVESTDESAKAVFERVKKAFEGVPFETRAATPDGKTRFLRPRPGPARMYPETDIPPVFLEASFIQRAAKLIPISWEEQIEELSARHGLSRKLAIQLFDSEYLSLFEELSSETSVAKSFVAATLTETLVSLSRRGLDLRKIGEDVLRRVFVLLDESKISKEAVPTILEAVAHGKAKDVDEALEVLGLHMISAQELDKIIEQIVTEEEAMIREKGERAFSPLMGKAMGRLRGKVDGEVVSRLLKERIRKVWQSRSPT